MELQFEHETYISYDPVLDVELRQEETLETIVPDACPDILSIAEVRGQAVMTDKRPGQDFVQVSGTVRATILYRPEGGGCLCRMNAAVPFLCKEDASGVNDRSRVRACVRLCRAEARLLNPRKILLRVQLNIHLMAATPTEHTNLLPQPKNQEEAHVCVRQQQVDHCYCCQMLEKPFTFEDQIRLKSGQSGEPSVLSAVIRSVESESKIIGRKLIFKGSADLVLLTQEGNGQLNVSHETLPFSQVMELPEPERENCESDVCITVQEFRWDSDPDDSTVLTVHIDFLAQAAVRCSDQLTLLRDLYSTAYQSDCQWEVQKLCGGVRENLVPQTVRELLETAEPVHNILDSQVSLGELSQQDGDTSVTFSVDAFFSALYLDENDNVCRIEHTFPLNCQIDTSPELSDHCAGARASELYVSPAVGGLELRFNVEFCDEVSRLQSVSAITAVQLGESRGQSDKPRPSVVLRMVAPGEQLWDIAKAYGTTCEDISEANGLEQDQPPEGTLLLVPAAT